MLLGIGMRTMSCGRMKGPKEMHGEDRWWSGWRRRVYIWGHQKAELLDNRATAKQ